MISSAGREEQMAGDLGEADSFLVHISEGEAEGLAIGAALVEHPPALPESAEAAGAEDQTSRPES
jgi:hypothetical protein